MVSAFYQLCPRYSGTLAPFAPTAIRLWETFTFLLVFKGPLFSEYIYIECPYLTLGALKAK